MKRIFLSGALLLATWCSNAQNKQPVYTKRPLKIDEINLVTSYYHQDGNRSAVTGGIGTELLSDYATSFDLKVSKIDKKKRVHSFNFDFNIDYYTSASSDNIDPLSVSGASRADLHIYPSLSWTMKDPAKHTTQGVSLSYSTEYDYKSYGINLNYALASDDNNTELSLKAGAFWDTWKAILPAELRPNNYGSGAESDPTPVAYKPRNTYNFSVSISQIINDRLQVLATVEPTYQEGLLSTPYHRVYFLDGSKTIERLPGSRLKFPIGFRASYFLGDQTIIRAFYRIYADDWGMKAQTLNLEGTYKITPFLSLSPFYRFNTQTAVRYFKNYGLHSTTTSYHTSDSDISSFDSHFIGTGFRIAPPNGILGIAHLQSAELRYGHYLRTNGLTSDIVTLLFKIK